MVKFGIKTKLALLAGIVTVVFSSCEDALNVGKAGTPVRFGVVVERNETSTRTAYSGEVVGGRERIDWENEDKILIHMESKGGAEDEKEYLIVNIKEAGYRSEAQVSPLNGPLVWEDENTQYRFVGIYPSDCAATYNKNYLGWAGEAIEFTLPNMQDGSMRNAYMAAITGYYSPGTKATLQFYPMVTTLYVILVNDTEKPQVVNQIILENQNQWETPMVGHYIVNKSLRPDWEYNWKGGVSTVRVNVNQTIPANSSRAVPVFIIPKERQASALKASIYLSDKKLTNTLANNTVSTFNPLMKYDISIKLSGEGTPVVDPVTPEIPPIKDLSDAVAQLFAISIKHWLKQNEINMLLSEFYQDQADPWNYFNINVWSKLDALIDRQDFNQVSIDDLIEVFGSEEAVEKLLEFLWQQTYEREDVTITASPKIQTSLYGEELFYLFPNATSLYLQLDQSKQDPNNPIHIDVEGFPYLKTITIEYAQSVGFKKCPSLTTGTIRNKASNYKGYTKEECPNLTVNEQ